MQKIATRYPTTQMVNPLQITLAMFQRLKCFDQFWLILRLPSPTAKWSHYRNDLVLVQRAPIHLNQLHTEKHKIM